MLTQRELEILELVGPGIISQREAAEKLGLKEKTIKNTLHMIHQKLDTHRTGAAYDIAKRKGLIKD